MPMVPAVLAVLTHETGGTGGGGVSAETQKVRVEVEGRTLTLTNLDKVLYPETGFTKGQVIDYYRRIAPVLLPHIAGRPLTLKRYPNGVHGAYFYEKNAPSHRPPWVPTARIASPGSTKPTRHRAICRGRGPADPDLGGQPRRPGDPHPDVAAAAHRRTRPACLRPRSGRTREPGRLLPRGAPAAATARAGRAAPAGQDVRRQGPAAVRRAGRDDLRQGERPCPRPRRAPRAGPSPPGRVTDEQDAAPRQGIHRLEPEQRGQDHRRAVLASCQSRAHRVHPGHLGRSRWLPAPGRLDVHQRHRP